VLILGDVLNNVNIVTGARGLHEPPWFVSADLAENRRSARKLAKLEPKLALFGHGPRLRDTRRFVEFVNALPD
jgi:hydroxyacylglutathione hydrolase